MIALADITAELERTEKKLRALEILRDLHLELGGGAPPVVAEEAPVAKPVKPKRVYTKRDAVAAAPAMPETPDRLATIKNAATRQPTKTPPGTKHCGRCETTKPLDDFGVNASRSDGRQTQCKTCVASYQRHFRAKAGGGTPAKRQPFKKHKPKSTAAADPEEELECLSCAETVSRKKATLHMNVDHKKIVPVAEIDKHFARAA